MSPTEGLSISRAPFIFTRLLVHRFALLNYQAIYFPNESIPPPPPPARDQNDAESPLELAPAPVAQIAKADHRRNTGNSGGNRKNSSETRKAPPQNRQKLQANLRNSESNTAIFGLETPFSHR